jgi:aryl-alcohol dehydrogenase-like predicted oxidoreductase
VKYNQLGNTGLFVSELCLGTMTFGGTGGFKAFGDLDQTSATAMMARSFEAGINFLDTSNNYSYGVSETMVGQGLRDLGIKRSDVIVATKCYQRIGDAPNDIGASRAHIMDSVSASLDRLGLDHIDLYQIHSNDIVTPLEETLRALDDLVSARMVRYVGVSNWQAWKIMKAQGIADKRNWCRFESLQSYYSIAGRDIEREIVPFLEDQKVGLMVWSPLAGGLLSGKFSRDQEGPDGARRTLFDSPKVDRERAWACIGVMREVAQAHGCSVACVALAWVVSRSFVTSVITGARTMAQLEDNLASADLILTPEELARLDEVSALPVEYPGWFIARQTPERRPPPFKPNAANS